MTISQNHTKNELLNKLAISLINDYEVMDYTSMIEVDYTHDNSQYYYALIHNIIICYSLSQPEFEGELLNRLRILNINNISERDSSYIMDIARDIYKEGCES